MTTHYGVWSDKRWCHLSDGLLYTPSLAVARAEMATWAMWFPQSTFEARAIGEDGLPVGETTCCTPKMRELGEVWNLLDPRDSRCVKSLEPYVCRRGSDFISRLVVKCTLPLDVETAVGLQIVGDWAVADPGLELTILAGLEEEKE